MNRLKRFEGGIGRARRWPRGVLVASLLALSVGAAAQTATPPAARTWKNAAPGRPIVLPADHASHPDYKLEWWYYTGNLDADDGRRFGYQVTFFRVGVSPDAPNRSVWAVRDLFFAHLALTDANGRRHLFSDRLNRAGPGWAGADTDTLHVWNEDWQVSLEADSRVHLLRAAGSPSTGGRGFGVELRLEEDRPPVRHGDRGYAVKGADAGTASYYYSLPRMPTSGTVTIDGRSVAVTGLSWMDHEFGSRFLEPGQLGWDWFSMQFQDGRSLMLVQYRRADGSIDPRSAGTLVNADGTVSPITVDSGFELTAGRGWLSPDSGARYPVVWHVRVPPKNIDLEVRAVIDAQELRTTNSTGVTYWEGAIDISGQIAGSGVKGRGYLEMTGYAGITMADVLR